METHPVSGWAETHNGAEVTYWCRNHHAYHAIVIGQIDRFTRKILLDSGRVVICDHLRLGQYPAPTADSRY